MIQWIVLGVLAVIGLVAMILILFGHKGDSSLLGGDSSIPLESSRQEASEASSKPEVVVEESSSKPEASESSKVEESSRQQPQEPRKVLGGVADDYFDDALFIGDSRTVGLFCCGMIDNATYFAQVGIGSNGLLYSYLDVPWLGNYSLDGLLSSYDFSKVYLCCGINSLAASPESVFEDFCILLNEVRIYCPDAIIYVQSNIKATAALASNVWYLSASRIDEYNDLLSTLDNGRDVIYLDIAKVFEDEDGYLDEKWAVRDGLHMGDEGSLEWAYYLKTHALINEGEEVERDHDEVYWDYPGYDGSQFTPMPRKEESEVSEGQEGSEGLDSEGSDASAIEGESSQPDSTVPGDSESGESTPGESVPPGDSETGESTPGESTPEESTPSEDSTPEETPGETPGGETPGEETPGDGGETPGETETPGEETPGEETPGEETPGEEG